MSQLLEMYTLRDTKNGTFGPPVHASARGSMLRSLLQAVRQKGSLLADFPQDFDLYELGTYLDADGSFQLHKHPKLVGNVKFLMDAAGAEPKVQVVPPAAKEA